MPDIGEEAGDADRAGCRREPAEPSGRCRDIRFLIHAVQYLSKLGGWRAEGRFTLPDAMQRTLGLVAAVILCLALTACHQGSGYAERVDVPLAVSIQVVDTPKPRCGPVHCQVGYRVEITNQGDETVYARDCVARGLDQYGHAVFETVFGSGIGPGASTEPGKPYRGRGTLMAQVTARQWASVRSLEGSCLAYVWHGNIPI